MAEPIDETGKTYGQWTVLGRGKHTGAGRFWRCRCDCGRELDVYGGTLRQGKSTGCGCRALDKMLDKQVRKLTPAGSFAQQRGPSTLSAGQKARQSANTRAKSLKVSLAPVRLPEER